MNAKTVVRRRVGWAGAAAAAILLLAVFMTVPALRSFAGDILSVFTVQETDRNPGLAPTMEPAADVNPDGAPGPQPSGGLTLAQIESRVDDSPEITFDLVTPDHLPAGFEFDAGMVDTFGRMVQLTYVSTDRLSLLDLRMYDLANPNPAVEVALPLGASSTVEAVAIDGLAGEYVRGDYGADGDWDATAPVQTLAWQAGEVLYVITTHEQSVRISMAELVAVAESISR